MKRDVDTRDGDGGFTAFEGDGFGSGRHLSDVGADEGKERCVIQVPGREGIGSMAQGVEGLKCTGADVLLHLDVVIYDFKERIGLTGDQID